MPWPRYLDKWVIKTWYNNTMEPHWVVRKNEIMKYVGKWNPESVILSKVTHTQKDKNHINFFTCRTYFLMNEYKCMWVQVQARKLGRRPWEGKEASRKRAGRSLVHAPCALPLKQQHQEYWPENWTTSGIHEASLVSGASAFSFPLHRFSSGFVV